MEICLGKIREKLYGGGIPLPPLVRSRVKLRGLLARRDVPDRLFIFAAVSAK